MSAVLLQDEAQASRLAELNGLDRLRFVELLGGVFEHSPWVADAAWPARPFANVAALHDAMVGAVRAAKVMERLEIAPNRRLRGLGKHQTAALVAEFARADAPRSPDE